MRATIGSRRPAAVAFLALADLAGQREPVHLGHVKISEQQAVAVLSLLIERQRLDAVTGDLVGVPPLGQETPDHHLVGRIVFGDENESSAVAGLLERRRRPADGFVIRRCLTLAEADAIEGGGEDVPQPPAADGGGQGREHAGRAEGRGQAAGRHNDDPRRAGDTFGDAGIAGESAQQDDGVLPVDRLRTLPLHIDDPGGLEQRRKHGALGIAKTSRHDPCVVDGDGWSLPLCGHRRERQLEPEGRAGAGLRVDSDRAVHHLAQAVADRQAETRTAIPARGRSVGLGEGLEEPGLLPRRQADARIDHVEAQALRFPGAAVAAHAHRDAAGIGELDRVARKIQQDLAQPRRVAGSPVGQPRIDIDDEVDRLVVRPAGYQLADTLDHFDEREGNAFDLQLSGLELRDVENVVDYGEQGRGG